MRRLLHVLTAPLAASVLLGGCAGGDGALDVGGALVADPDALADEVASSLRLLLEGFDAAVSAQPSCWFSVGEDGRALPRLFCGPVAVYGGSGPWAVVDLDVTGSSPSVSGVSEVGVAAPRGRALLSGSGGPLAPPAALDPPPLRDGQVVMLGEAPPSLLRTSRSGWELRAPASSSEVSTALKVLSTVEASSFGSGYSRISAPPGSRLLVVEIETRRDVGGSDVLLGGARLTGLERFVLKVVPEGEPLPALVLDLPGAVQSLSLVDGSRSGEYRSIWYSSPQVRAVSDGPLVSRIVLPRISIPNELDPVAFPVDVAVAVEMLAPSLAGPSGKPAPPGSLWVPVLVRESSVSTPSQYVPTELSFSGLYAAGEVEGSLAAATSGRSVALYALVPEGSTQVELRVDVTVLWSTQTFAQRSSGTVPAGSVRISADLVW